MTLHRFGRYEVEAEIGQGAMGKVYRAFDPLVQRRVAIKAIKDEILAQDKAGDYIRRFQREARAAGGLSHPNILTIYDVGENYFVMEYLEGKTLLEHLAVKGRLTLTETVDIISPVVDALDYAHRQGVYHRDIKPANIMILPGGTPKLMDFGLAHLESTVLTSAGQFLGSPSYMSPEQIKGEPMADHADRFSLAVVTYEMLTGNKPFPGDSITTVVYRVVNEDPVPPRKWVDDLPPQYDDIFRRALAKKPEDRFDNFADFLTALNLKEFDAIQAPKKSASAESRVPEAEPTVAETLDLQVLPSESVSSGTERKTRGRHTLLRPLLAVLVVVLIGAVAWLMRTSGGGPPVAGMSLTVETEPPGAEVWLDGRQAGFSPIELVELAPGIHAVRVSKEGYRTESEQVEIVGEETPPPLSIELVATAGFLSLESDPTEALVSIDGEEVGNSPVDNFVLEPGEHEIRVEKKGFLSWSMEVEAVVGESLNLVARLAEVPTAAAAPSAPQPPKPAPAVETRPAEPEIFELGPGITPPKKISGNSPTYPPMAKRLRQEGTVSIRMIVTEEGDPIELEVVESASDILDEAVMKAVQGWKYEPAKKDGSPVRVYYTIRQTFRIGS